MKRRLALALLVVALCGSLLTTAGAAAKPARQTRAGVAVVDATWHLGAAQGQYAGTRNPAATDRVDPYAHATARASSYGLGSRITARALVVEDADGNRMALLANDLYLSQDLLNRRIAQLLADHDRKVGLGLADGEPVGIDGDNLAVTSSHSHSSPYYSSGGWGVWVFQDVADLRFFEHMARTMAGAVIEAAGDLVPVRMGGATSSFNEITSHSYGPQVADDGTPAGAPWDATTGQLSVVRFDDISNPRKPKPLANWVVMGLHPEWVFGDGLVTGDIATAMQRTVDRELGGVTLWSQRETGTAGPHKDLRVHEPEDRREFQDGKFGQLDRAARLFADAVTDTWRDIERGTPEIADQYSPFATDFGVSVTSQRFAPPATRPYPGVSNCNTEKVFDGNPGVPIVGLPDCGFFLGGHTEPVLSQLPVEGSEIYRQLKEAGVPIPESYSATALSGVEETAAVHLQAIRLGGVGITLCPCEQFTDQARNIATRLDKVPGNLWLGHDWSPDCSRNPDETWTCRDPRDRSRNLPPVSDLAYRRMVAQVHNDAAGWEDPAYAPYAEAEPADPAQIKGNFTHTEHVEHGYDMVLPLAMANDYWGYIPTYREYRQRDQYRKALSGLGPHGADFLATRLSRMAASLNGADAVPTTPLDIAYSAESARMEAVAAGIGTMARGYAAAYEETLPGDGGDPGIAAQPADIRRFDAAHLRWVGGSSWTDLPEVRVERRVGKRWEPYGDTSGEVQTMVRFPTAAQLPAWRAGQFTWEWTAAFEAFASDVELPDASGRRRSSTPAGTYRFVVDGHHRSGSGTTPYTLASEPFRVRAWDGVTADDLRVEPGGAVSFAVGPRSVHTFGSKQAYPVGPIDYPDSYESPFPFIRNQRKLFTYGLADASRHQQYCLRCSFRPWADTAEVSRAVVTVRRAGGGVEHFRAVERDERWVAATSLAPGDTAIVEAGGVVDTFGERNGEASPVLRR